MQLKRKLKIFLIYTMLISYSSVVCAKDAAQEPVIQVRQGETLPFSGWCFTESAMARILANKELEKQRCDLVVENKLEKQRANYTLQINNLQIRLDTVTEESKNILLIKEEEIRKLEAAALKRPNDYTYWWASGGFVLGAATTLLVFFAVK